MTNPSYTDEQVRQLIKWHEEMGYPIAVAAISSLFSDRQRLQAELKKYEWLPDGATWEDDNVYFPVAELVDGYDSETFTQPTIRWRDASFVTSGDVLYARNEARANPTETKEAKS